VVSRWTVVTPGHDWLQRERLDGFAENAAALTLAAPAVSEA